MKVLAISRTPMEELHYAAESISSFTAVAQGAIANMSSRLHQLMPNIITGLAGVQDISQLPAVVALPSDQRRFLELVKKVSFAEVRSLRAYVPEGFSGSLVDYSLTLKQAAEFVSPLQAQLLHPFNVLLGVLLSSSDARRLTDDKALFYGRLQTEREHRIAQIGGFFHGGKESHRPISEVMSRNGDWETLLDQSRQATAMINSVDRALLSQSVKQADETLKLIAQLLEQGKLQHVTPETSRALSEGALQVAQQLEFYSVVHYRILGLNSCVQDTTALVAKVLG